MLLKQKRRIQDELDEEKKLKNKLALEVSELRLKNKRQKRKKFSFFKLKKKLGKNFLNKPEF